MGGRGIESRITTQFTIKEYEEKIEISKIIQKNANQREAINSENKNNGLTYPILKKRCACCEEYTLEANSQYEICPICGWIDDPYQNKHPDSYDGRNPIPLSQAKIEFMQHKAKF